MVKVLGITQARVSSSRLPGKVLMKIDGKSLLEYHLKGAVRSQAVDKWVVATTHEPGAEEIVEIAGKCNAEVYQGSVDDVLDRYYQSAAAYRPEYIARITSDCPLLDPALIDEAVKHCLENRLTYYYNIGDHDYPDGFDVEVFSFAALENAWQKAVSKVDREHVTSYIRSECGYIEPAKDTDQYSHLRLTVDEPADFKVISALIGSLGHGHGWKVYADYLLANPAVHDLNKKIIHNEGYMNAKFEEIQLREVTNFKASDEYRAVIHNLIPGGAHTYSKGDDQFPALAPAAISHGKGAYIWDIDGNMFLDCAMGLTSVGLGHAYEPVLKAVREELERGVNFQRPSVLERKMAEKFLSLVPQHDMVKFAKNGSIVTTAAVKLARAKTGRKLVAFPGDHPFYSYDDWFIGKTACNKGVPKEISDLSVTFRSCDIDSLRELFEAHPGQIACVITEPEKNHCGSGCNCKGKPAEFLQKAIELAHSHGALFIIDEMVTGFRTGFPGTIGKHGLEPDMATWGKGIANGFSFCALTGKKEVMELGGINKPGEEKVFLISTTHGGETHSMAAAITAIDIYKKENVVDHNRAIGKKIVELSQGLVEKHGLAESVYIMNCEWMPVFVFKDKHGEVSAGLRTLFMQEMIRRGVLFQGVFVPCLSHTEDDVYYFARAFDESLNVYKKALGEGYQNFLKGEPAKPVFRKYL